MILLMIRDCCLKERIMAKNILMLTGSPRRNGNSDKLADAFMKGAIAAGHHVFKFETGLKRIRGCTACKTCWSKGTACSHIDDFALLEPLLENADVIVFSTPLYWFGMSAQIKAAIDRVNAYLSEDCLRPLHIGESALLICGADAGSGIFSGAVETYKNMADYMKWKDRGILTVPEVRDKGDIDKTEALAEAEKLGKSI
jgi:multimeric flavodoxin WrbA